MRPTIALLIALGCPTINAYAKAPCEARVVLCDKALQACRTLNKAQDTQAEALKTYAKELENRLADSRPKQLLDFIPPEGWLAIGFVGGVVLTRTLTR